DREPAGTWPDAQTATRAVEKRPGANPQRRAIGRYHNRRSSRTLPMDIRAWALRAIAESPAARWSTAAPRIRGERSSEHFAGTCHDVGRSLCSLPLDRSVGDRLLRSARRDCRSAILAERLRTCATRTKQRALGAASAPI